MKTTIVLLTMVIGFSAQAQVQPKPNPVLTQAIKPSIVDFDAFVKLAQEVKEYRKDRLVNLKEFLKMSEETNTVILDTRSDALNASKHIKGAIHLDFTDFTQENLRKLIPNPKTRILIYCNNNFEGDETNFATKIARPIKTDVIGPYKPVSLALNIPTYINLYGYGYKNIYELSELVIIGGMAQALGTKVPVEFEGTSVPKKVGTK